MNPEHLQFKPLNIDQTRWITAGIGPGQTEPPDGHPTLVAGCTCCSCTNSGSALPGVLKVGPIP